MFVWIRIFFLRVVWPIFYTYRVNAVIENASFQRRLLRVERVENLKTPSSRLSVLRAWRIFRKGFYRISFVSAFSSGRAKTIRIRYVWMHKFFLENGEKKSPFPKISGHVRTGPKWVRFFLKSQLIVQSCFNFFIAPSPTLRQKNCLFNNAKEVAEWNFTSDKWYRDSASTSQIFGDAGV